VHLFPPRPPVALPGKCFSQQAAGNGCDGAGMLAFIVLWQAQQQNSMKGQLMRDTPMHGPLKWVSLLIILLMVAAIVYASFISIKYWAGIGV
jgi:hypothetical protein